MGCPIMDFFNWLKTVLFREEKSKLPEKTPTPPSPARPVTKSKVLVLVVNAKHKALLNSIEIDGRVSPDNCQALYRATQELWLGEPSEFKLMLETEFSNQDAVPEKDQSEYDVYFVVIDLSLKPEDELGFKANVSSIERLDAFEKLPEIATGVKVSPRLPSSAYELSFLYAR